MGEKKYILSKAVTEKKLLRMAYEILERNPEEGDIILAGVKENGVVIARKIAGLLKGLTKASVSVHEIGMDKKKPMEISVEPAIDFNDKVVILVDDVANSGRTLLYAIKPFLEFHPKKIQTLVLVERMHKAFPVSSDYVGLSVGTTLQEHIVVEVEGDEISGGYLI